jgi:hypothetical protein
MKKIIIMLAVAVNSLTFYSCKKVNGERALQTEDRAINNFSGLTTSISGKIYFTQGANYQVQVTAQQNILDVIETYKIGSELIIKFRNNVNVQGHSDITVNITAPLLNNLHLSGAAHVNVKGNFIANDFDATVSSSGNFTIDHLEVASTLSTSVSGSGSIKLLSGKANESKADVSGSGAIDLSVLRASHAAAKISGSGSVRMNVAQTLDAAISGSGNVYYWGNPSVSTHISGSGKVIKM